MIISDNNIIYCIIRSVSKSGMSRRISLFTLQNGYMQYVTHQVAELLDYKLDKKEGIRVDGCGMDMCSYVVDLINRKLGTKFKHIIL